MADVIVLSALRSDSGRGRKALLVLSLTAACDEAQKRFEQLLAPTGKHVSGAYGSTHTAGPLRRDCGVLVCTYENAHSL